MYKFTAEVVLLYCIIYTMYNKYKDLCSMYYVLYTLMYSMNCRLGAVMDRFAAEVALLYYVLYTLMYSRLGAVMDRFAAEVGLSAGDIGFLNRDQGTGLNMKIMIFTFEKTS